MHGFSVPYFIWNPTFGVLAESMHEVEDGLAHLVEFLAKRGELVCGEKFLSGDAFGGGEAFVQEA